MGQSKLMPVFSGCFLMVSWRHRRYSTPVDVWSIGCIFAGVPLVALSWLVALHGMFFFSLDLGFAEMHLGRPLFPGQSESSQRDLLFQQLGTPTDATLPGVTELPKWKAAPPVRMYPPPPSLAHLLPDLPEAGVDLLSKMLIYNPAKRISAAAAMEHPVRCVVTLASWWLLVDDGVVRPQFFADLPDALKAGGLMGCYARK
jgi:serine/threonine protein kinase